MAHRGERAHQTLQDRLVKALRLQGLQTLAAANAWLPTFLADDNRRFAVRGSPFVRPSTARSNSYMRAAPYLIVSSPRARPRFR